MLGNIFFKDEIEKKFWYFCWKMLSFQSAKLKKVTHFLAPSPTKNPFVFRPSGSEAADKKS